MEIYLLGQQMIMIETVLNYVLKKLKKNLDNNFQIQKAY